MIKIIKRYRSHHFDFYPMRSRLITRVDEEGNLRIMRSGWCDARTNHFEILITTGSLRQVRDACNVALRKISGGSIIDEQRARDHLERIINKHLGGA